MKYNRILTIQDISCLGQCSMTVALPIISACGQETCIIPSAVLPPIPAVSPSPIFGISVWIFPPLPPIGRKSTSTLTLFTPAILARKNRSPIFLLGYYLVGPKPPPGFRGNPDKCAFFASCPPPADVSKLMSYEYVGVFAVFYVFALENSCQISKRICEKHMRCWKGWGCIPVLQEEVLHEKINAPVHNVPVRWYYIFSIVCTISAWISSMVRICSWATQLMVCQP